MRQKRINTPLKNILPGLLLCLLSSIGFAQPSSSIRFFLENRLTELVHPSYYTQYFRFADAMFPDRFTLIQEQNSKYAVYDVKLTQIQAMDIVLRDTAVALVLTFHRPLKVTIQDDFHGKPTGTEERQTITFPLAHHRDALHVRQALQDSDSMLDFTIRKQKSDRRYPEMVPMPEIKASPAWLGMYPVTVQQYRTYCEAQQEPMPPAPPWGWHADHPIVGITWQEAKNYVRWLNQTTRHHYDLPPLHVWQYAALDSPEEGILDDIAWWGENAGESTKPVGQKLPNRFGLYDMQGNVWEWVDGKQEDKQHTAAGGSWDSHFAQCQWNSTASWQRDTRDFSIGFRVVRYQ